MTLRSNEQRRHSEEYVTQNVLPVQLTVIIICVLLRSIYSAVGNFGNGLLSALSMD